MIEVPALVLEVTLARPRDALPPEIWSWNREVLVSQLVLVIVVGVDLNVLPIPLDPVEGRITVWLEAARQHTAPPKHTVHLGVWRSENRGVLEADSSLTLLIPRRGNSFVSTAQQQWKTQDKVQYNKNTKY